jgi:hypothetical protein
MVNRIELQKWTSDFEKFENSDFNKGVNLKIFSATLDLLIDSQNEEEMGGTIFGLWIEFGNGERTIMIDFPIDELELFAKTIINHIDIIRKSYCEQIKYQQAIKQNI